MRFGRYSYRVLQFWNALFARPAGKDIEWAVSLLTPEQMALFNRLHRSEQAHSLAVLSRITQNNTTVSNEEEQDLFVAALLHDVGKTLYPIRVWDRVLIVLANAWFPNRVKIWGSREPVSWRRVFVVAEQHAEWGAQLAAQAGASPLTVELIRQHQNLSPQNSNDRHAGLLRRLQAADQDS